MQSDPHGFRDIEPTRLSSLLTQSGWERIKVTPDKIGVFRSPLSGRLPVPLSRDFEDYPLRVKEILAELSETSHQSINTLLEILTNPPSDFLKFKLNTPQRSLKLDHAVKFYACLRDVCKVAAAQFAHPQTVYTSIKGTLPDRVQDYWLVQPAVPGSYQVDVACPLDSLDLDLDAAQPIDASVLQLSKSRQVVQTLTTALTRIHEASRDGSIEELTAELVPRVSYNLCDKLLSLQPEEQSYALEFAVDWGTAVGVPAPSPRRLLFEPRDFEFVGRAAERLAKTVHVQEPVTLLAKVKSLSGRAGAEGRAEGMVVLSYIQQDGPPRTARVNFNPDQYAQAMGAHGEGKMMVVEGTLHRRARLDVLTDAHIKEISQLLFPES